MKDTGIIRKVDRLGRIVLPSETRKKLDISPKDDLEIYSEGECIVLKKSSSTCTFCGNTENTDQLKDKSVCQDCIDEIKQKA